MRTVFFSAWDHRCMGTVRAPSGLGKAGRALWRDLMAEYGLNPVEAAILVQVCRCVDRLEAIEVELAGMALVVAGSMGRPRCRPLLAAQRAPARVLESQGRALAGPPPPEAV